VGLVSCLYSGRGSGNFWSRFAAMGISYHFLPNAALGLAIGLVRPCFGSTIALSRQTLDRIGGFEAFTGHFVDDYEIGRAARGSGILDRLSRDGRAARLRQCEFRGVGRPGIALGPRDPGGQSGRPFGERS
jgi:hypothetical protein